MNLTMPATSHHLRRFLAIGAGCAAFALIATACGDTDDDSGTATTNGTETTTTTTAPGGSGVVWPPVDGSVTYDDPVAAATGFAVDFVGFVAPVVGEFLFAPNAQEGTVEVRPNSTGPVTNVLVRQSDAGWVVLGATTATIVPTVPAPLDQVSSPLQLKGTSTAPEGAVGVRVRDGRSGPPLAESYVTGGSMGEMGPFDDTLDYPAPATADGSVTFYGTSTDGAGGVLEATVIGVEFVDP